MTSKQFERALADLGVSPRDFADMVGVTPRQVLRWRRGVTPIPRMLELLMGLLIDHGVDALRRTKLMKVDEPA